MRAGQHALVVGLLLASSLPAHAWMTYVGRDVGTGERLGLGASVDNEDEDPVLSVLCTPDGLTATFDTGYVVPPDAVLDTLPTALLVAADGGAFDPFPVLLEGHQKGERMEMRLRLEAAEAIGLAQYVLGATDSIRVGYRLGEQEIVTTFSNDSATVTIGAVLAECEGRGKTKSKG